MHKEKVQGVATTIVNASDAGCGNGPWAVEHWIRRAFKADPFTHLVLLGSIEAIPSPKGFYTNASCDHCYAMITEVRRSYASNPALTYSTHIPSHVHQ